MAGAIGEISAATTLPSRSRAFSVSLKVLKEPYLSSDAGDEDVKLLLVHGEGLLQVLLTMLVRVGSLGGVFDDTPVDSFFTVEPLSCHQDHDEGFQHHLNI